MPPSRLAPLFLCAALLQGAVASAAPGYFRQVAAGPDRLAFIAAGDVWTVGYAGGTARRLTTAQARAAWPAYSADGRWLAFTARYDGAGDVYVMPAEGGTPRRITHEGDSRLRVTGWSPDGRVVIASTRHAGRPEPRLYLVDPVTLARTPLPLADAAETCLDPDNRPTLFTRGAPVSDNAIGYAGGGRQQLWHLGAAEAVPAFAGHAGTSRQPMCAGRDAWFLSDRDGRMNVWSARIGTDGTLDSPRALTRWQDPDVRSASLAITPEGPRIAYVRAGDLHVLDPRTGSTRRLDIALQADLPALRPALLDNPASQISAAALSPSADRVALVARGYLSVFPAGSGRRLDLVTDPALRVRDPVFMPDGRSLVFTGDRNGEQSLWTVAARSGSVPVPLPGSSTGTLSAPVPSPDGRMLAYADATRQLWLLDLKTGQRRNIAEPSADMPDALRWSPDSRWLAWEAAGRNDFSRIWLFDTRTGSRRPLTSDRYHARNPVFSPDGKILYFLSDRHLASLTASPWGQRDPAPFFDKQTRIYGILLDPALRWPFLPADELAGRKDMPEAGSDPADHLYEVPLEAGNYDSLDTDGKRLFLIRSQRGAATERQLIRLPVEAATTSGPKAEVVADKVRDVRLSADRKKLLLGRQDGATAFFVIPADGKAPADLATGSLALNDWSLPLDPPSEWRQIFLDTWRMHRDKVHPATLARVDWTALRDRYLPLAERVTDRQELGDVIAQMVAHIGILHSQVLVPDALPAAAATEIGHLGADVIPVPGGLSLARIWNGDPELLEERAPVARPETGLRTGDVILRVNGRPVSREADLGMALRGQTGQQVLLDYRRGDTVRQAIVRPVGAQRDQTLRYLGWEWERKTRTDTLSGGRIGYLHLQAMGTADMARWAREYYPVFDREGLIIDLRDNKGGNIDRWLLEKLLRRTWAWWQDGNRPDPVPNPPYAFRGPVVALIDGGTYSDGETFALGLRQLGIATLIGTRTAGAGMWLSDSNATRDKGLARAASMPQFVENPDGTTRWVIEGRGVTPDIDVDNLPGATFRGEDAQLDAAIRFLQDRLRRQPVTRPAVPQGGAQPAGQTTADPLR